MGMLKKIIGRFKPQAIDMLLYQFPVEETSADQRFSIDGLELRRKGNEFSLWKDDVIVHRSRVFFKSNLLSNFGFPSPLMTIGDCLTDDRYRGKGIYPQVIRYLGSKFAKERKVFILVSPDNSASIRGIEKAGFTFVSRLKASRLLIFCYNKSSSPAIP